MKHHNIKDCFFFQRDIKIIFTDSNRAAETVCGGGASWTLVILWVDDEDANHTFLKSGKKIMHFFIKKKLLKGPNSSALNGPTVIITNNNFINFH